MHAAVKDNGATTLTGEKVFDSSLQRISHAGIHHCGQNLGAVVVALQVHIQHLEKEGTAGSDAADASYGMHSHDRNHPNSTDVTRTEFEFQRLEPQRPACTTSQPKAEETCSRSESPLPSFKVFGEQIEDLFLFAHIGT